MTRFLPQNWNDVLALALIAGIPVMWGLQGIGFITIEGEVNGALISMFTLVVQYYFRRAPPTPEKAGGEVD